MATRPAAAQPEPTDEALVDALNRGDAHAFERLYNRHREWVWRVAVRYLGDESEAWDVVQVVFMDFLKRFPGFRLTSRLTTYLYPVTRHFAYALARKRKRAAVGLDDSAPLPARAGPEIERDERLARLSQALALLPAIHAEVLLMRYVDDMSMEEIGAALGVPPGTVKSRLHHALAKLQADPDARGYFSSSDQNQ
ncbi:MAG: RNA polymerase sigma factor [Phycisphaerales bacterium]